MLVPIAAFAATVGLVVLFRALSGTDVTADALPVIVSAGVLALVLAFTDRRRARRS